MPNPFQVQPANPNQGLGFALAGLQRGQERDVLAQEKADQQQKLEAQAGVYSEYMQALESGDFDAQRRIEQGNPMLMKQIGEIRTSQETRTKGLDESIANDVLLGGLSGQDIVAKYGSNLPDDMAQWFSTSTPEQIRKGAIQKASPESYKRHRDALEDMQPEGSNLGTVSPKDFTVESMAAYEKSGDINDLVRYRPKTAKIGNIEHQYNAESQKWEPLVDYSDAGLSEQEAAAAENEAARQAILTFGKDKSKFESGRTKYLTNISASEQKQTVVRNTADKIKDLMGGWANKYGAFLSNIPASDARTLKGLIDTMKANSAFSTLIDLKSSGGTLGAISEAELNLLERAWGALDQGGDIVEFERVLEQLVGQNAGSLSRLRNAFSMDKDRYSGSYEDSQRKIQEENTTSWDEL